MTIHTTSPGLGCDDVPQRAALPQNSGQQVNLGNPQPQIGFLDVYCRLGPVSEAPAQAVPAKILIFGWLAPKVQ